jgi:hypothetical protein
MTARLHKSATLSLGFAGLLIASFADGTFAASSANRTITEYPASYLLIVNSFQTTPHSTNLRLAGKIEPIITRKPTSAKKRTKQRSKPRSTDPLKVIVRPTDDMNRGLKKTSTNPKGIRTDTGSAKVRK